MEYEVNYNPSQWRSFKDERHLTNYINVIMRTDVTQRSLYRTISRSEGPLTRSNLYFIRKDGEMQHFQNVSSLSQRKELRDYIKTTLSDIPVTALRMEKITLSPYPDGKQRPDLFSDLVEETLPELWRCSCPLKGQEEHFLDGTVFIVMHNDTSFDGETLQCVLHRLYVTNYDLFNPII